MYEYVIYILLAIIIVILAHVWYKKITGMADETTKIFSSASVMNIVPSFRSASGTVTTLSDKESIAGSA